MSRFVLLREFPANLDTEQTPDDDYISRCNSSLEQKPYRIRTDANGFIVSGNSVEKGCSHVIAIGDSVCENLYVEESQRVWSVLSRLWSKPDAGPVEVLNAGVSGNHILHIINVVLNKIVPLRPRALLYLGGATDRTAASREGGPWSKDPEVCTIVQKKAAAAAPVRVRGTDFSEMEDLLAVLASVCSIFEIPVAYLTVPLPQSAANEYYDTVRQSNEVIRNVCRRNDVALVDLEGVFERSAAFTYDEIHFNQPGAQRVAEAIASSCAGDQLLWFADANREHAVAREDLAEAME
jgi:lysophospholipase L1-like esterase